MSDIKSNEQHWIVSIQDSINGYREVQSGYYDGTKWAAANHFQYEQPFAKYYGDKRYQITMKANPILLQYPD